MANRRLVDAHIEAQRRLRLLISQAVGKHWSGLGSWDQQDVERFLAVAVPTVLAGQRSSVSLTEGYLAQALKRRPIGVNPDGLSGASVRNGTPPETVYRRPFIQLWSKLGEGKRFDDALHASLARVQGSAATDVQLSSRATFQAVQNADDGIYGYERVADGGACNLCESLDGVYVKDADASPVHSSCGCSLSPLDAPHPSARYLPSGQEVVKGDGYAIHQHGEMGSYLASPDQQFTTEAAALRR